MSASSMQNSPMPKNHDSVEQDQFLTILSREDALARFEAALFPEFFPVPDAVGGGKRKTQLMRQHQHLTAMVSFVPTCSTCISRPATSSWTFLAVAPSGSLTTRGAGAIRASA